MVSRLVQIFSSVEGRSVTISNDNDDIIITTKDNSKNGREMNIKFTKNEAKDLADELKSLTSQNRTIL